MVILTGGAGFIGSCFLARLNAEGIDRVLVVDNLGHGEKWRNLQGKSFTDYIHKDAFRERIRSGSLIEPIDAIFHLGACSSTTETNAEYVIDNNYRYSRELAEWAIGRNIPFIYASSAATYGDGTAGFSDDATKVHSLRPLNVYGYSKQLFDEWVLRSGIAGKVVGLKFFNVFGPNEYHKGDMQSVVRKAVDQIAQTGEVRLFRSYRPEYADGEQRRDFIYVDDCCDVLWWLFQNRTARGIFNLGSGTARSWLDLTQSVFAALGLPPKIVFIEMPEILRAKYQYFTEAPMQKLRDAGYRQPFRSLEDGVTGYVQGFLREGLRYR